MRHRIVVENPAILYDYPKRLRALRFASRSFLSVAAVSILSRFVGCTVTIPQPPYVKPAPPAEAVYVISGGWHTELGLHAEALGGPLTTVMRDFPTARYLVFGWGE